MQIMDAVYANNQSFVWTLDFSQVEAAWPSLATATIRMQIKTNSTDATPLYEWVSGGSVAGTVNYNSVTEAAQFTAPQAGLAAVLGAKFFDIRVESSAGEFVVAAGTLTFAAGVTLASGSAGNSAYGSTLGDTVTITSSRTVTSPGVQPVSLAALTAVLAEVESTASTALTSIGGAVTTAESAIAIAVAGASAPYVAIWQVPNYAALRAAPTPTAATACYVAGYANADDGGGGFFWWRNGDTTSTDNNGTLIVATSGARWARDFTGDVKLEWFGAQGDFQEFSSTFTISAGSPALGSSPGVFTSAMVGKVIVVPGAGASGAALKTTILSYASPTAITLAANASTAISAGEIIYVYTDNAPPINSAVGFAQNLGVATEGAAGGVLGAAGAVYACDAPVSMWVPIKFHVPYLLYTPTTQAALYVGNAKSYRDWGYNIRIGTIRALNGNLTLPTAVNYSGNCGAVFRCVQFSDVQIGMVIAFTYNGIYFDSTNTGVASLTTNGQEFTKTLTANVTTVNVPIVQIANGAFGAGNVGNAITIPGAGASGGNLVTTIASVINPTTITTAATFSTVVNGASETVTYGSSGSVTGPVYTGYQVTATVPGAGFGSYDAGKDILIPGAGPAGGMYPSYTPYLLVSNIWTVIDATHVLMYVVGTTALVALSASSQSVNWSGGQQNQQNRYRFGQIAYNGVGIQESSISAATGAVNDNIIEWGDSFANYGGLNLNQFNDNDNFYKGSLDAPVAGGYCYSIAGSYNQVELAYVNGPAVLQGSAVENRITIGNDVNTGVILGWGGVLNKVKCGGNTNLPLLIGPPTDNVRNQNNYGVPINVAVSFSISASTTQPATIELNLQDSRSSYPDTVYHTQPVNEFEMGPNASGLSIASTLNVVVPAGWYWWTRRDLPGASPGTITYNDVWITEVP